MTELWSTLSSWRGVPRRRRHATRRIAGQTGQGAYATRLDQPQRHPDHDRRGRASFGTRTSQYHQV